MIPWSLGRQTLCLQGSPCSAAHFTAFDIIGRPHSSPKCNTSGGGDRFSCRMMLRIGQEAATVPVTKQGRLSCPRAIAT